MTPEYLRDELHRMPTLVMEEKVRRFWYYTGLPRADLIGLDGDELMILWARFVMEGVEELMK